MGGFETLVVVTGDGGGVATGAFGGRCAAAFLGAP